MALDDLERLEDFLAGKSVRAANAAIDAIEGAIYSLSELPERGRPSPRGKFRELLVPFGKDGYVLRYRVRSNEVVILRIFHARERRR
jgi:plasmid stabilization system protein ParE